MDHAFFIKAILSRLTFEDSDRNQFLQRLEETADLNEFLDHVAMEYLEASDAGRAVLRNAFKDWEEVGCLNDYARQMCDRIRRHKEQKFVRFGLVALSLADCRPDPRDTLYDLGHLYRAAQQSGIFDPMPLFREVGALSIDQGSHSCAALMRCFDRTQVCRELAEIPVMGLPALVRKGDLIGLRARLRAGDDPNAPGPKGVTPLMIAARSGSRPAIQLLLESGARVDSLDEAGWSALVFAAVQGHWGAVELLRQAGARGDVQPEGLSLETFLRERAPRHLTNRGVQILNSMRMQS